MKTTKRTIEDTYQYNRAYDLVTESLSRITFLLESAPCTYTDQNFSREGLSGMSWILGDISDKLTEAGTMLSKLTASKTGVRHA